MMMMVLTTSEAAAFTDRFCVLSKGDTWDQIGDNTGTAVVKAPEQRMWPLTNLQQQQQQHRLKEQRFRQHILCHETHIDTAWVVASQGLVLIPHVL